MNRRTPAGLVLPILLGVLGAGAADAQQTPPAPQTASGQQDSAGPLRSDAAEGRQAAPAPGARVIDFEEAVRIALERNSSLRQARNAAAIDDVAVQEARRQFLPDLRFSTQGAQNYGRNFLESEGRILEQSTRSANVNLSSGVVLFDGFANTASLREARLSRAAGERDLQRTSETVVFTVASNFLALVQQREQLRVRRESLLAESALEEQIRSFVEAGARTIADLYQQQASVASARFAVVEAERAAGIAVVDLIQTLQLDPGGSYEFEVPELESLASSQEAIALEELMSRAIERRIDLEAGQARVGAAEERIRIARAGRWPTVSLSAGYGSAYTSASEFDLAEQLDRRRGGSIGLGFSIPLFDRGTVAAAARRAELQAEDARIALSDLRQEIGLQVRRAHLDYRAAREQFSASEAQLRAAERALEATQERYRAGAATLVELSQARAVQVQAASALVAARYGLLFQRTLIDYYVGDLIMPGSS